MSMNHINDYSKDAINSRLSVREVTTYTSTTEHDVTEISFGIGVTHGWSFLFGATVLPGIIYGLDYIFNDGGLFRNKETHYFDVDTGKEISYSEAQSIKAKNKTADKLEKEGRQLFSQQKYDDACEKLEKAYNMCTSGYSRRVSIKNSLNDALNQLAERMNQIGSQLFERGDYEDAFEKFTIAYRRCTDCFRNKQSFQKNCNMALREMKASNLLSQGHILFGLGYFEEARNKYLEALKKSDVSQQREVFKSNVGKAEIELDAVRLNAQGDDLFSQGLYSDALGKYQEALDISCENQQWCRYINNIDKVRAELEAAKLNFQGRRLFEQGKYDQAIDRYAGACEKSQMSNRRLEYKTNCDKAERISNCDKLFSKAWDVEKSCRPGEARKLFRSNLAESKDSLDIFPDNHMLQQRNNLVSLKIDGNELFNQGTKLYQTGLHCLDTDDSQLAVDKLYEAKIKLSEALNKFREGEGSDVRFGSCVQLAQKLVDEISQLIADQVATRERVMDVNIRTTREQLGFDDRRTKAFEEHSYNYKQIS